MAAFTAASLSAFVQTRLGGTTSDRLIQLTNDDNSATTIDATVLEATCLDAIGDFQLRTGANPDESYAPHGDALIDGVLLKLEDRKGRNVAIIQHHGKNFYGKLKMINARRYVTGESNSTLEQTDESTNAMPDMDRKRQIFTTGGGRISAKIKEVWED